MTETAGRTGFFVGLLPIAAVAMIAAGCSTTNLEDVAPVSSMQAPQSLPETMPPPATAVAAQPSAAPAVAPPVAPATAAASTAVSTRDAIDTGTFPNLNVAPGTAAAQLTPGESAAKLAELGAKRSIAQAGPATDPATEAEKVRRLKKLALTHADDTLKAIEAE